MAGHPDPSPSPTPAMSALAAPLRGNNPWAPAGANATPAAPVAPGAPIAFPSPGQAVARDFHVLSEEEIARLTRLEEEFWKTADLERRRQILEEVGDSLYGGETLAFLSRVLDLGDEDLSAQAVEMLSGNTAADILPVLEKALRSKSEGVRASAAVAVGQVRDDRVVPFLGKVFDDPAVNVRHSGLNVLDAQPVERKLKILGRALEAAFADVQTVAIGLLEAESTPQGLEVLFQGLDAPDPAVRREAQFSIDFLIDQEFRSSAEARGWWQQNRTKFDKDLTRKE